MTTPTNRDELVKMLTGFWADHSDMLAWDAADALLSALDGAGIALVPRDGCAAIWGAGNHVRYVTHGETGDMWGAMLSASPFEKDRER